MYTTTLLLSVLLPLTAAVNTYRTSLNDCLNSASVPILLANSNGWAAEISPYNLRFTPVPNVVAIPRTVANVQDAVKCAKQYGVKLSVKSGGHSYGAYGLAGQLIVDLQQFQTISLDSNNIATVGGGVRLGNLATKLYQLNKRALPHGTCEGVGVGGHATNGGFGLDGRLWGLLLDTIVSLDIVLADGTLVTISTTQNPDLFWAVRGAGGSYGGVIVTFRFQTFAAIEVNINWAYTYTINSASNAAQAFKYAADWAQDNAPKELGYGVEAFPGKVFVIRGVYYGPQATYNTIIAPVLAKLKSINGGKGPDSSSVTQLGWIDSLTALAGAPLTTPVTGYNLHDTFYVKSIETKQSAPLSLAAYQGLFNYLYNSPPPASSTWFIISNLYGGPSSVITSFPPSTDPSSTSSYAGRDTGYVWQVYGNTVSSQPPFVPAIQTYIKGIIDSLGAEAANLPAYPAYVDTALSQTEAQTRYWGAGVQKLKTIKAKYDPTGVFYNPQGF